MKDTGAISLSELRRTHDDLFEAIVAGGPRTSALLGAARELVERVTLDYFVAHARGECRFAIERMTAQRRKLVVARAFAVRYRVLDVTPECGGARRFEVGIEFRTAGEVVFE